jgi:hypothetical protein
MMPNEFANTLQSALGLFLLWYLFCFRVRDYVVDAFREELFASRDELFNYVASIGLSHEDERHTILRNFINSTIRFSHKLTFFRVVLAQISKTRYPAMYTDDQLERWKRALDSLPDDQKEKLICILHRVMRAAALQMVWRSPFLLPVIVTYKVATVLSGATFYWLKRLAYEKIRLGLQEQQAEEQPLQANTTSNERLAIVRS